MKPATSPEESDNLLKAAVRNGDLESVQNLINGIDLSDGKKDDLELLHIAALHGHKKICELLINRGSKVDEPGKNGPSPLLKAVASNHYEVCELLLDHGANIHVKTHEYGSTLIIVAGTIGSVKICELLLKHGIKVDEADKKSCTPLLDAAVNGHYEVCELLLKNGAKVDEAEIDSRTPLCYAAMEPQNTKVCELLISHKSNVHTRTNRGETPLIIAASKGCLETCELRFFHHANLDEP